MKLRIDDLALRLAKCQDELGRARKSRDAFAAECGRFQVGLRDAVLLLDAIVPKIHPCVDAVQYAPKVEALRLMSILTIEAKGGDAP
jgi:hypothetical protein